MGNGDGDGDGEHQVAADAWGRAGLTPAQQTFVRSVLPDVELVADHSWGLLDTVVLHVRSGGRDLVVKACGPANTHFPRELTAHRGWTDVLVARGDAGALVAADEDTRVLVLDRVPGRLALGTPDEHDPAVHRQAGALLRRLHDQTAWTDPTYAEREQARTTGQLDQRHRIPAERVEAVRAVLARFRPTPVTVVPTHGDWQPRNWVVDDGRLRAIDLGRFAFRPAATDLTRLAVLHWQHDPALETAFIDGYGGDPRTPDAWRWIQLREAVGTAVWAHEVGDAGFEEQGHRMLDDALAAFAG
ncbi:aminoglycoside phosphotransferase family protein [Curtobacterium sp. MCBA15_012]|uniref:aminoglycoside phosphotransferase family protein n=1 Tax=Curtobacterium sp. MCBA15_012 TaxID=1898738 RepID=UPI000A9936D6|nr:aminoglycoside phosphotransferase family protein [Curtobacterium sp. MCBA15_012]WIB00128.1 aminoglycoside phosphotransferase family protein [Curtobacterium sp. MCBA15_012]